MKSGLLSLPRQSFPEALTAEDAGYEDGESDEDCSHGVEKYRLLAELHVLPAQLRDHLPTDGVQASPRQQQTRHFQRQSHALQLRELVTAN